MSHYGSHSKLRRSTEPVDAAVWHWFICNGPHGERFTWQRKYGNRDIEFLTQFMNERQEAQPGFLEKARLIAVEALENTDAVIVFTGVQVFTVVGHETDMQKIQGLLSHHDERVVVNTRSALFERRIKIQEK